MSDVRVVPDVPGVSAAVPVAARGASLVLAAPPSPAYAVPVLAAFLGREPDPARRLTLLLAPEGSLEAWGQAAAAAAAAAGRVAAVGPFPSRAAHHLAGGRVDLLVTTRAVAGELVRRSALRVDALAAMVVVWPEAELADDDLTALMADLPKDTPRMLVTADPAAAAAVIERHLWRAPVLGPLGGDRPAPVARLRVAAVGWDGRLAATAAAADLLDADQLAVWTADASAHRAIAERLASHGVAARLLAGTIPDGGPTVFFDAPPPELLAAVAPETAIVLAPPGTEWYLARVAARLEPVRLPGVIDHAERAMLEDRRAIRSRLEAGPDRGAYATVAPLFDRFGAAEVAIALQSLWAEARTAPPAPAPAAAPRAHPKVWISAGKKEGTTHGEVLGLLTLDLGLSRDGIGRIEIRDTFTLIEFAALDDAQRAIEKLAGHTFKRRRLTARLDRGRDPRRSA